MTGNTVLLGIAIGQPRRPRRWGRSPPWWASCRVPYLVVQWPRPVATPTDWPGHVCRCNQAHCPGRLRNGYPERGGAATRRGRGFHQLRSRPCGPCPASAPRQYGSARSRKAASAESFGARHRRRPGAQSLVRACAFGWGRVAPPGALRFPPSPRPGPWPPAWRCGVTRRPESGARAA